MTLTLKKKISLIALITSIIALVMAISTNTGGVVYEAEKISLKEKAKSYLKEAISSKDKPADKNNSKLKIDHSTVFLFSLSAVIIGILTIFIKEPKKKKENSGLHFDFDILGAALALGFTALLWNYILIAIIIAVIFYLFSSFSSGGIDIGF